MVDKTNIINKVNIRFFTLGARLAFARWRQAFTIAPNLHYFDLICHTWIKTNALGLAIS